jgi:hypothetical protein
MQAPNRTTELMSAAEDEGESPKVEGPPTPFLSQPGNAETSVVSLHLFPPRIVQVQQCRIQTAEVVAMARMVPVGMDFWASLRSPERLEPAMIPANRRAAQTGARAMEHQTD